MKSFLFRLLEGCLSCLIIAADNDIGDFLEINLVLLRCFSDLSFASREDVLNDTGRGIFY
jgi:hypothetical protein